jgi:hypothetical protein
MDKGTMANARTANSGKPAYHVRFQLTGAMRLIDLFRLAPIIVVKNGEGFPVGHPFPSHERFDIVIGSHSLFNEALA